jgi:hypothetical protein
MGVKGEMIFQKVWREMREINGLRLKMGVLA